MRIALLQTNPTAGDIDGNAALIARGARQAKERGADLAVTPELALMSTFQSVTRADSSARLCSGLSKFVFVTLSD